MKLDKFDSFLIRCCKKRTADTAEYMAQVWRWRCDLTQENTSDVETLYYAAGRLIEILDGLGLASMKEFSDKLTQPSWNLLNYHENKELNRLLNAAIYFVKFRSADKFPDDFYWGAQWGKRTPKKPKVEHRYCWIDPDGAFSSSWSDNAQKDFEESEGNKKYVEDCINQGWTLVKYLGKETLQSPMVIEKFGN